MCTTFLVPYYIQHCLILNTSIDYFHQPYNTKWHNRAKDNNPLFLSRNKASRDADFLYYHKAKWQIIKSSYNILTI